MVNLPRPKYSEVVYQKDGFKVELSNQGEEPKRSPKRKRFPNEDGEEVECGVEGCDNTTRSKYGVCSAEHYKNQYKFRQHSADWIARLVPPGYDEEEIHQVIATHKYLTDILWDWADGKDERIERLDSFVLDSVMEEVPDQIPDATALQNALEEPTDYRTPDDLVAMTTEIVDEHFPESDFGDVRLEGDSKKIDGKEVDWDYLPLRAAASLYILACVCEEANRGDGWYINYKGFDETPERAGCYMSLGFYLFLRFSNANRKKIEKIVNPGYI